MSNPNHHILFSKNLTFHLRLGFPSDLLLHLCNCTPSASISRAEKCLLWRWVQQIFLEHRCMSRAVADGKSTLCDSQSHVTFLSATLPLGPTCSLCWNWYRKTIGFLWIACPLDNSVTCFVCLKCLQVEKRMTGSKLRSQSLALVNLILKRARLIILYYKERLVNLSYYRRAKGRRAQLLLQARKAFIFIAIATAWTPDTNTQVVKFCVSMATFVTRMHHNITLYVHCLSCLLFVLFTFSVNVTAIVTSPLMSKPSIPRAHTFILPRAFTCATIISKGFVRSICEGSQVHIISKQNIKESAERSLCSYIICCENQLHYHNYNLTTFAIIILSTDCH